MRKRPSVTRGGLAGLMAWIILAGLWACQPVWPPPTPSPPAGGTPTASPWAQDFLYLGVYGVLPAALDTAAQAGVRVVSMPPADIPSTLAYLDAASSLGLRVRLSLSPSFLGTPDDAVLSYIRPLAEHPAIVLWYLPEEPKSSADRTRWRRLYHLVREHDPMRRPVGLYLAEGATAEYFAGWSDICDVFFAGAYPEYYGIPRAALYTRVHNAARAGERAGMHTIGVPQLFDAAAFPTSEAAVGTRSGHPDALALRADAYTVLIAGADGIDWYSLEYGLPFPDMISAWKDVLAELRILEPVLLHPLAGSPFSWAITRGPQHVPSFRGMQEPALVARAYQDSSAVYLLAVNLSDEELEVQFRGAPASLARISVLFEGRETDVRDGTWSDTFAPHQVHVYRLPQETR